MRLLKLATLFASLTIVSTACDDPDDEGTSSEEKDPTNEVPMEGVGGFGGDTGGGGSPSDSPEPADEYVEDDCYFEIEIQGGPLDGETLLAKKAGAGFDATQNVDEDDSSSVQFRNYPVEGRDIIANFQFYWEGDAAVGVTTNWYDGNGDVETGKLGSLVLFGDPETEGFERLELDFKNAEHEIVEITSWEDTILGRARFVAGAGEVSDVQAAVKEGFTTVDEPQGITLTFEYLARQSEL